MRVYVTKRALTEGIFTDDVDVSGSDSKYVYSKTKTYREQYIMGRTAFRTAAEAIVDARSKAERKAKSCRDQLKRLEALAKDVKWRDGDGGQ